MTPLTLSDLIRRSLPPVPWAEGDNIPWDDPEFSRRMLAEHLSQDHDLASRRVTVIDEHVRFLDREVVGGRPTRVLDLACGPGLYCHRLAGLGHECVGIDFSPASVAHAEQMARNQSLSCRFVRADLRDTAFGEGFGLVLLLYGQLNVFRRDEARRLLRQAQQALEPGGRLVLEPQSYELVRRTGSNQTSWQSAESGLFSDSPHLSLYEWFWDEESQSSTERFHVIDAATAEVRRIAMTNEAYTEAQLQEMLVEAGFGGVRILPSVTGEAVEEPGNLWVIARR